MNPYLDAKPWRAALVWLPMALHPLDSAAAPSDAEPPGKVTSNASDSSSIEVPRKEATTVPAHMKDRGPENTQRAFVDTVLPLVLLENERIEGKRKKMEQLFSRLELGSALDGNERDWLRSLAAEYRVDGDPLRETSARKELRARVDIVPADLAIAQAATETGWGVSRAAHRDRDLFGMTAIPTRTIKTASGKRIHAPRFDNLRESVRTYIHNLNSHVAYSPLRTIRAKLRTERKPIQGTVVAEGLVKYSQRGKAYVKQVRSIIQDHGLGRYVNARLMPGRDQMAYATGVSP